MIDKRNMIMKRFEKDEKEKGLRYATAVALASILFSTLMISETDEELENNMLAYSEFPDEAMADGMAILDIFASSDCSMSIHRAADIYFAKADMLS